MIDGLKQPEIIEKGYSVESQVEGGLCAYIVRNEHINIVFISDEEEDFYCDKTSEAYVTIKDKTYECIISNYPNIEIVN